MFPAWKCRKKIATQFTWEMLNFSYLHRQLASFYVFYVTLSKRDVICPEYGYRDLKYKFS